MRNTTSLAMIAAFLLTACLAKSQVAVANIPIAKKPDVSLLANNEEQGAGWEFHAKAPSRPAVEKHAVKRPVRSVRRKRRPAKRS